VPGACETDLTTTVTHCGKCETNCLDAVVPGSHTTGVCNGGTCGLACVGSFGDCDMDPTDCETDLTTDTDCGGCGRVCPGCQAGICPPSNVVTGMDQPTRIVSTTDAVWVLAKNAQGSNEWGIWKYGDMDADANLFFPQMPQGIGAPSDIAVDAQNLYVADGVTDLVYLVPLDGSSVQSFGAVDVVDVATDGTWVWALQADGAVRRAMISDPLTNETVTSLGAMREPTALALLPGALPTDTIALIALAGTPNGLGGWDSDGQLLRLPPGQSNPVLVSGAESFVTDVVTTAQLALWTDKFGEVRRASKNGWGVDTIVTGDGDFRGIATANEFVYFTDQSQGFVKRAKILAGPLDQPTLISSQEIGPVGITVHGPWVYWVNSAQGNIRRAPQ